MKYLVLLLSLFYLNTALGQSRADLPFKLRHAVDVIESTFGDKVRVKPKSLLKFGRSVQVDNSTFTTLMTLPSGTLNETYVETNLINKISSSSGSDTELIFLEGHTCDASGNKKFIVQSKTLAGQTETALDTAMCRVTRAYNAGSNNLVGNIYVYQDDTVVSGVPQTATKVHIMIPAGYNQSRKAATTISSKDYWLVTEASASIDTKAGSPIAELEIQVRLNGGVFRTVAVAAAATAGSTFVTAQFDPVVIVPKNADVRMRALGSAGGLDVSGWMNGYLALVQD